MILGKHTGKAALVEKLRERGIVATEADLTELLRRVKTEVEQRSKESLRGFVHQHRSRFEQPGLSDAEFWAMVGSMGLRSTGAPRTS